jgi:hypothetical protein
MTNYERQQHSVKTLPGIGCAETRSTNLDVVGGVWADVYYLVLGIYRKNPFSCQIYENKGAVFEIPS